MSGDNAAPEESTGVETARSADRSPSADEALREHDEYDESLLRLYELLGQANSYTAILRALETEVPRMLGYTSVFLGVLTEDGEYIRHLQCRGTVEQTIDDLKNLDERYRREYEDEQFLVVPIAGDPFLQEVIAGNHVVVVDDARTDPRTNKEAVAAMGNRTLINVPLSLAGRKLGVLGTGTFGDEGVRPPSSRRVEWLNTLANHVAVAMDRVRFIRERLEAEKELEDAYGRLERMFDDIVSAFATTASMRDPYTSVHQEGVARLAVAIARELGLDHDTIDGLRMAATLHDIGKLSVPAEILAKPVPLSEMEMGIVRNHPALAYELLENVEFTHPVAAIVRQHHERLDGSGYPDGITGDEMLPESRILAVADVVEAMSSDRPYRAALGIEAALSEVEEHAGVKYDAAAVAACAKIVRAAGRLP